MAVNPQTIMTLHSHTHGTSNRNHPQVTPNMGHVTVYDPGIVGLLRIYPSWFGLKKGYFNILQPLAKKKNTNLIKFDSGVPQCS